MQEKQIDTINGSETANIIIAVFILVIPMIVTLLFIFLNFRLRPKQTKTKHSLTVAERKILNKYYHYILNPNNNYLKRLNILYILTLLSLISPTGWICIVPNTYLYVKLRKKIRPIDYRFNDKPILGKLLSNTKDRNMVISIMSKIYGVSAEDYKKLIELTSELLLKYADKLNNDKFKAADKADALLFVGYFVINTIEKAIKNIPDINMQNSLSGFRKNIIENVFKDYFEDSKDVLEYYSKHDLDYVNMPLSCSDDMKYDELFIWNYPINDSGVNSNSLDDIKYVINLLFKLSIKLKNQGIILSEYFEDQYIDLYDIDQVDSEPLENNNISEEDIDDYEESTQDEPLQTKNNYPEIDDDYEEAPPNKLLNTNEHTTSAFQHLSTVNFSDRRKLEISLLNDGRIWINEYRTRDTYAGYTKKGIGINRKDLMSFINLLQNAIAIPNYVKNLNIDNNHFLKIASDNRGVIDIRYCVINNGRNSETKKGLMFTVTNAQKLLLDLYKLALDE